MLRPCVSVSSPSVREAVHFTGALSAFEAIISAAYSG
jgi:hypothetical protein